MMRGSGAGGLASRAMGSAVHMGHQGTDNNDRQLYFPSEHLNTRPPRFPTDPVKVPAWRHRMMLLLNPHGLGYTVKQSINPVNIISEDGTILARRHTAQVVAEHERAWTFLLDATVDAPFEETMLAAQTLEQAWHVIVGWGLPTSDAEEALLMRQLGTVQVVVGEDLKIYCARANKLLNTLKSVGIVKEEREIVRIIIRNVSDEYMVGKRSHPLTMLNISRFEAEETIRASYASRKYSDLGKLSVAVPAKAPPPVVVINDPHALAVCGGLRGGGSGGQRQSRGGAGGRGRWQHQGERGKQQQWSQGWNGQLPSHGGGQMRQQPFHQQQQMRQQPFHQEQTRRQPYQQQLLQPHHSFHHASPECGIGGHLIVVLTLLGGTKRNRHPRLTLRWAACTSASGAEDSAIWPRSVPLHSGLKVHAVAEVSMATATTTASPTSTTHTPMLTSLAIQVASAGGGAEICHGPSSNNSSSS